MSDTSQGPGWWLASDGRWYPPEAVPGTTPPVANPYVPGNPYGDGTPYGYGTPYSYGWPTPVATKTNGMAIASLVCSLVALPVAGFPAVLGVIFGFVARSQIERSNDPDR